MDNIKDITDLLDPGDENSSEDGSRIKDNSFRAPEARLLIVDDMEMNLYIIAGLLKRTDMQIDMALSGEECVRKFGEKDYDAVLLDFRMPDLNGIQVLEKIRDMYPEKAADTPVISLTGDTHAL